MFCTEYFCWLQSYKKIILLNNGKCEFEKKNKFENLSSQYIGQKTSMYICVFVSIEIDDFISLKIHHIGHT